MPKPWSDNEGAKDWDGFRATRYSLAHKQVWELPLIEGSATGEGDGPTTTTVGQVLSRIFRAVPSDETSADSGRRGKIEIKNIGMLAEITAADEKFAFDKFKNKPFNIEVLMALVELENEGLNSFATGWFWYDRNSVRDEPHESYEFFVVGDGKIVREAIGFSDHSNSGFDPSIFVEEDFSKSIWRNDEFWHDAHVRNWYRKFYRETPMGQLFALRSDEPTLFHVPEDRWAAERTEWFRQFAQHLSQIRRLQWAVVILLAVVLYLLWK